MNDWRVCALVMLLVAIHAINQMLLRRDPHGWLLDTVRYHVTWVLNLGDQRYGWKTRKEAPTALRTRELYAAVAIGLLHSLWVSLLKLVLKYILIIRQTDRCSKETTE